MTQDGLTTVRSANGFAATLGVMEALLEARGVMLFARVDHAAGAKAEGMELPPTTLLLFGAPRVGTPVMQAQRLMGLDLPLKALVWEDDHGVVWLSYEDPRVFAARHGLDEDDTPALGSMAVLFEAIATAVTTPASAPPAPVARTVARARDSGPGVLRGEVSAAGQAWIVDEPFDNGGTELGPSPHTMMSAALAACTALTVRAYADRKGWPLTHVSTAAQHDRQDGPGPPDLFSVAVTLNGDLDAAQKTRLMEIADLCPVHQTLTRGARVVSRQG